MEKTTLIAPLLFAEIVLLFDYDFPVGQIDAIIGVAPTESKCHSQTRVNPLTKKHNPGFWAFQTSKVASFNAEVVLKELDDFIVGHSSALHSIVKKFSPCSVLVRFRFLVRAENEYPAIRFEPEMLAHLSSLGATIDIDIENSIMCCVDEVR